MIGDRPDNDIAPARSVGMKTIRFRRGILYAIYDPRTDEEQRRHGRSRDAAPRSRRSSDRRDQRLNPRRRRAPP